MSTKLDDISEAIGALRAEVKNLGQKIDRVDRNAEENNRAASEHRSAIHKRVDDLVEEVGDMKSDVSLMKTTVADSKLVTDEVKQWKQRGIGALFVTGIASAAVGGIIVGFVSYWWDAIMRVLRTT
jgi:methyl-accepting chemotaxis protein